MELTRISQTARFRAQVDDVTIEASMVKEENNNRIEGGNITSKNGEWLGNFYANDQQTNFSFNTADREERAELIAVTEDFIEELRKEDAE